MAEPGVVIFTERPPPDWRRAALSLANACPGLTYADAARACRYSQGFLDLVLAPGQLEAAANALTAAGSPARVIATTERVAVPPAFSLKRIGIDDLGLSCLEPRSTAFARVPWRRVLLLHLAWVGPSALRPRRDPEVDRVDASSLGVTPTVRPPERQLEAEPPELWLELVLVEPFARLRIRMSSFVYDCLPDPAPRAEDNLRRLLELLAARVPKAIKAGLTEPCLAGAALDDSSPLDDHENDRAVSWELTRREFQPSTPPAPVREEPPEPSGELEGPSALLARYRRLVLLGTSIPLAVAACLAVLRSYPGLMSWRVLPFVQFALWVPIVLVLSVLYVGVQLRFDTKP